MLFTSSYSLLYNDLSGSGDLLSSVTLALLEMRVSKEKGMFNQSILPQQWGAAINGGSLRKKEGLLACWFFHRMSPSPKVAFDEDRIISTFRQ